MAATKKKDAKTAKTAKSAAAKASVRSRNGKPVKKALFISDKYGTKVVEVYEENSKLVRDENGDPIPWS